MGTPHDCDQPDARRVNGRPIDEPLPRRLSGLALWLLVINGVVGAGIFGLPTAAARYAGDWSPWIFLACAVLILPILLSFAELSSRFEGTGGPMRYTEAAFGPFAGFLVGWTYYLARLTAASANLALLVAAFGHFWPAADAPATRLALLLAASALLTGVTVVGTRDAIATLGGLTLLKLLPLIALAVAGIAWAGADLRLLPGADTVPATGALGPALFLVFYAYVGFESGLVPAGESRNPRRDVPRALLLGLATVALLYFALQAVALATVPELAQQERPLVAAAAAIAGGTGAAIVMFAVVASVGGNVASNLFSTPRVTYALALDGRLPAPFARVSRFGTPGVSIVVFGVLVFLLAAGGSFAWLAGLSVLTRVLIYVACILALCVLRRRAPGEARAFPGRRVYPWVGLVVCIALLTQVSPRDYVLVTAVLALGSLMYAWARRRAR